MSASLASAEGRQVPTLPTLALLAFLVAPAALWGWLALQRSASPLVPVVGALALLFTPFALLHATALLAPRTRIDVTPTHVIVTRGSRSVDAPLESFTGEVVVSRRSVWLGTDRATARRLRRAASPLLKDAHAYGVSLHEMDDPEGFATGFARAWTRAPDASPWDGVETRGRSPLVPLALRLFAVAGMAALLVGLARLAWTSGDRAVLFPLSLLLAAPLVVARRMAARALGDAFRMTWAPTRVGLVVRGAGEARLLPWQALDGRALVPAKGMVVVRRAARGKAPLTLEGVAEPHALAAEIRAASGAA